MTRDEWTKVAYAIVGVRSLRRWTTCDVNLLRLYCIKAGIDDPIQFVGGFEMTVLGLSVVYSFEAIDTFGTKRCACCNRRYICLYICKLLVSSIYLELTRLTMIDVERPVRSVSGQTRYRIPSVPVKIVSAPGQALIAAAVLKRRSVGSTPMKLRRMIIIMY